MRYFEIIEASKADSDPEHDREERAELWRKLDNARHKRSRAGQDYQDRVRSADDEQRKAQLKLAEDGNDEPDYEAETERWKRYWVRIPTQGGQVFRFDRGHHSDLIAATLPI